MKASDVCPGCGFGGESDGPAHAYMSFSAACWARYGEILAREFGQRNYWPAHRVLTDACCGQHSVGGDRRARQSLHIHLAALMLHFDDDATDKTIVKFLRDASKLKTFSPLSIPPENHMVSIAQVHSAKSAQEHCAAARLYGQDVLDAWKIHHPVFRALIKKVMQ